MTDPTPAGWYPDPLRTAEQRWWDGTRWTDHVHGAPPLPAPPPVTAGASATAMSDREARNWAVAAHATALAGLVMGLSFLGPLIVYLVKREDHPFVRRHAAEALNFNLSVLLYAFVLGVVTVILLFIVIGMMLIPVFVIGGLAWLVLTIIAAVRAGNNEDYRYPLTIRFVD